MRVFHWLRERLQAVIDLFGGEPEPPSPPNPFEAIFDQLRIESERVVREEIARSR
jgi:hypothetical protein